MIGARESFRSRQSAIPSRFRDRFIFLGDADHLLDRGDSRRHFFPTIIAQSPHALVDRFLLDRTGRCTLDDERAESFVDEKYFIESRASHVPHLLAILAAAPLIESRGGKLLKREPFEDCKQMGYMGRT